MGHDKESSKELDLDETYLFSDIKAVEYYGGNFYILANRLDEVIGQYLFFVGEDMSANVMNPELNFIIKQTNKFNIGDGSIDITFVDRDLEMGEDGEQVDAEDNGKIL